ncbi:uncharacterized protein LOC111389775 [Olea europaea var. sylvestris]|uniref:uncharacterized protein LOC111389775 n=1 Tax=Olea europaea var. sylvestris TaxID=158386 RepID=UPI000C1D0D15|nr:uncharacterized protein LOC111389775 [Olea europaea var. sylvestris]
MPSYAKFMKDILSNKRKLEDNETVMLTEECSEILQHKLPSKLKDPESFTIPYNIGEAKSTTVSLQLADRSIKQPRGSDDVQKGQLILRLNEEELTINVFRAFRFQSEPNSCILIDVIKDAVSETIKLDHPQDPLEACLVHSQDLSSEKEEAEECARYLATILLFFKQPRLEFGERLTTQKAPALELKQMPTHLRYAYLGEKNSLPVIISNNLIESEED